MPAGTTLGLVAWLVAGAGPATSTSSAEPPRDFSDGAGLTLGVEVVYPPGPHRIRAFGSLRPPTPLRGIRAPDTVALGDRGLLLRQTVHGLFVREPLGTERTLYAAASGRVFGEGGLALRPTAGSQRTGRWTWVEEPLGLQADIYAAVSTGIRTVAVGERGLVLFEPRRGAGWRKISTGVSEDLRAVTGWYDTFIAVGDAGRIVRCEEVTETGERTLRCAAHPSPTETPLHHVQSFEANLWAFGRGFELIAAPLRPRPPVFAPARMAPEAPWLSFHDFRYASRPFVQTSTDGVIWLRRKDSLRPVKITEKGLTAASKHGRHFARGDGAVIEVERIPGPVPPSRVTQLLEAAAWCTRDELHLAMPEPLDTKDAMRVGNPRIVGEWTRSLVECTDAKCGPKACCNRCRWQWGLSVDTKAGPRTIELFRGLPPESAAACALDELPAPMQGRFLFHGYFREPLYPLFGEHAFTVRTICRIQNGEGRQTPALEPLRRRPLTPHR